MNCFVSQHDAVDDVHSQVGLLWLRMCRVNLTNYCMQIQWDQVRSIVMVTGQTRPLCLRMWTVIYCCFVCQKDVVVMLIAKADRCV